MKSVQVKVTSQACRYVNNLQKITVVAGSFNCRIKIVVSEEHKANAKSIISLTNALGHVKKFPCKIEIRADGLPDETKAVEALAKLFAEIDK